MTATNLCRGLCFALVLFVSLQLAACACDQATTYASQLSTPATARAELRALLAAEPSASLDTAALRAGVATVFDDGSGSLRTYLSQALLPVSGDDWLATPLWAAELGGGSAASARANLHGMVPVEEALPITVRVVAVAAWRVCAQPHCAGRANPGVRGLHGCLVRGVPSRWAQRREPARRCSAPAGCAGRCSAVVAVPGGMCWVCMPCVAAITWSPNGALLLWPPDVVRRARAEQCACGG